MREAAPRSVKGSVPTRDNAAESLGQEGVRCAANQKQNKKDECHPSTATMAKNLHYCRNTVASYVRLLEERGLIVTEHTKIITKNGIKKNGSLLYTIIPLQEVMEQHYEQQFNALERTTERRKVQAKLAEQLGA